MDASRRAARRTGDGTRIASSSGHGLVRSAPQLTIAVVFVLAAWAADALAVAATSREAAFADETRVAMDRMMSAMEIRPTGDVDRDFATMMIPHHQGAIDMALAELRYGSNESLRRLAQEIVVAQQQEIAVMRLALDQPTAMRANGGR